MRDAGQRAMLRSRWRDSLAGSTALLLAGGTLVCCALPILLVSLGLGSAVVALTSAVPSIVTLSQYKEWIFAASGIAMLAAALLILRADRACPIDPALARACARADRWNRRVLGAAIAVWSFGFFMAYLLLPLSRLIG